MTKSNNHKSLLSSSPPPPPPPPPPIVHAFGGSIGSALALLLVYPLERLRIDLQKQAAVGSASPTHHDNRTANHNQQEVTSLQSDASVQRTKLTVNTQASNGATCPTSGNSLQESLVRLFQEGELYQGVTPICTTLALSNFIFFYTHHLLKQGISHYWREPGDAHKRSHQIHHAWKRILASSLAGIVNVLLTNPLWVTNLRIVTGNTPTQSLYQELKRIYEHEGLASLWKGTESSLWLVSNPVLQFVIYEHMRQRRLVSKRQYSQKDPSLSAIEAFLLGAIAKAVATIATYPLQLSQAVLRLQGKPTDSRRSYSPTHGNTQYYKGTLHCLRRLYQKDGTRGLFRGMRAKMLQTVLTAAFTFLTYEEILQAVHRVHQKFNSVHL